MIQRMNWEQLLSNKRVSDYDSCDIIINESQFNDPRSPFEKDFDQITFSYPFRRLQDKTQVIPFPKYDFVHTRLTHSLEVASVGRSFGKLVAPLIFKELSPEFTERHNISKADIGALVAASCLAHDIGNPPFGHSGEDSISHYFLQNDNSLKPKFDIVDNKFVEYRDEYNPQTQNYEKQEIIYDDEIALDIIKRYEDLSNFEGNANGFRIITQNCSKGINPTYALLGTFTKYPRESYLQIDPYKFVDKKDKPKSQTKYGFFQEQKKIFEDIANELGLIKVQGLGQYDSAYYRHPLAFCIFR